MNKQIKDYLPFYLGCECKSGDEKFTLVGIYGHTAISDSADESGDGHYDVEDVKPILRPLSSMSEVEKHQANEAWYAVGEAANNTTYEAEASRTKYLFSKHFDLFGLIEAGLAIDATTINHE